MTRAYRDAAGVWTIGIGHTASAGPPKPRAGMVISRAEAYDILARDLPCYENRVRAALGPVRQTVFDAAVSFDFNTGAIHRASWVKAFRSGNMTAARVGLLKWVKAGGRTIRGLVRRREAEARLLFEGLYDAHAPITQASDEIRIYQGQLIKLGFLDGVPDGICGPKTKAAVFAYQRARKDLIVDGIAGPATRASLQRDIEALALHKSVGAAVVGITSAGGIGAVATDHSAWLPIGIAAALGLLLMLAAGMYRRRGTFLELLKLWKR